MLRGAIAPPAYSRATGTSQSTRSWAFPADRTPTREPHSPRRKAGARDALPSGGWPANATSSCARRRLGLNPDVRHRRNPGPDWRHPRRRAGTRRRRHGGDVDPSRTRRRRVLERPRGRGRPVASSARGGRAWTPRLPAHAITERSLGADLQRRALQRPEAARPTRGSGRGLRRHLGHGSPRRRPRPLGSGRDPGAHRGDVRVRRVGRGVTPPAPGA